MLGPGGHVWYIVTKKFTESQESLKASDIRRWLHVGNSFAPLEVGFRPYSVMVCPKTWISLAKKVHLAGLN